MRWAISESICTMRSVSMRPGARVLTVMPSAATWSDSVLDQAVVALRTALESMSVGSGCLTDDEVLVMTRPQCLARMDGRHRRVSRMADIRLSSKAPCQSSSVRVSNMPGLWAAGVVEEDVDAAEGVDGGFDDPLQVSRACHVGCQSDDPRPWPAAP